MNVWQCRLMSYWTSYSNGSRQLQFPFLFRLPIYGPSRMKIVIILQSFNFINMYDMKITQQTFGMAPCPPSSIMAMPISSSANKMKKNPITASSTTMKIVVLLPSVVSMKK
mmetsp:Transcript_11545/g.20770  ORF Transcript_11545/g.20770 Transcript_11545/m.20770 type:complete len:111 (-) Transcript_11545:1628-1960(-)